MSALEENPSDIRLVEINREFLDRLQDAHRDLATNLLMHAHFDPEPEPPDVLVMGLPLPPFKPKLVPPAPVEINPVEGPRVPIYSVYQVLRVVARHFDISIRDIVSERRTAEIMRPRHIAMYLAHELTLASYPRIGACMGGRDHTTILHGVRKIAEAMKRDQALFTLIADLTETITSTGTNAIFDDPLRVPDDPRVANMGA